MSFDGHDGWRDGDQRERVHSQSDFDRDENGHRRWNRDLQSVRYQLRRDLFHGFSEDGHR